MIEGAMHHRTDLDVEANCVDSHSQSEVGFGLTSDWPLGFELKPGRLAGPRKRRATATVTLVSQPEMQRQVRQQRADIGSLYELVESVDRKVDTLDEKVSALDVKLDRRLDELSGQLAEVLRQLGGR